MVHLSICIYVGPPDILLKEAEALSGDPIVQSQRPEVNKLVHEVDVLCYHLERRPGQAWFRDLLNLCPVYLEA